MIVHAVAFMALAIPLLYGATFAAGTLSKDSQTKAELARRHYAEAACYQHLPEGVYLVNGFQVTVTDSDCGVEPME